MGRILLLIAGAGATGGLLNAGLSGAGLMLPEVVNLPGGMPCCPDFSETFSWVRLRPSSHSGYTDRSPGRLSFARAAPVASNLSPLRLRPPPRTSPASRPSRPTSNLPPLRLRPLHPSRRQ